LWLLPHDDEPPSASCAPEKSFEVVVVCAVRLAAAALLVEKPLYPVEQLLDDQWLVPAGYSCPSWVTTPR
jgi:hypothetical protein